MNRYIRVYFFPGIFLLGIAIGFLFFVKHKVFEISRTLHKTQNEIVQLRENIHILKAEYSYLTSPKRVSMYVSKHLTLVPPSNQQVLTVKEAREFLLSLPSPQPTAESAKSEGDDN